MTESSSRRCLSMFHWQLFICVCIHAFSIHSINMFKHHGVSGYCCPTEMSRDGNLHSVQFSHSVVSNSLRPHESRHARPSCPPPTPRVHSDLHPSSQWCHPAISSLVVPFFSCPQSLPASGSFSVSQLFARGGQSIAVSASTSVLPKNTQDWYTLG